MARRTGIDPLARLLFWSGVLVLAGTVLFLAASCARHLGGREQAPQGPPGRYVAQQGPRGGHIPPRVQAPRNRPVGAR